MFITKIKNGVIGGLAGGAVFGMMMAMMGMLPMIGKMVGIPNALAGFVVHMAISASIGASFGVLLGSGVLTIATGLVRGGVYGMIWWVLGPLTLMPLMMGMGLGVNWNATAAANMLPSLMGHVIFGLVMGLVFAKLSSAGESENAAEPKLSTVRGGA